MGYYRAGDGPEVAIEPLPEWAQPEVSVPDPLADPLTRTLNLGRAYGRLNAEKDDPMGYYRAGDDPSGTASFTGPSSSSGSKGAIMTASEAYKAGQQRHYRHMHVTNVKALRRSMRRVLGFTKLAKRLITFTHHVKLKKRRRK